MTEKEKAKAYDEAIERAKKLYSNRIAEEIFPELKESNDERIKKNCIHFLELQKQHHAATFEIEECISWLENQGKKYIDKNKPRFTVGDWVVNKFGNSWHIDSLDKKNYQVSDEKGNYNYFPISKQDEMHLWTIQDAKDRDVIYYRDEISLYKHDIKNYTKQEITFGGFVYYCCYDGKRFITDSFYILTKQDETDIHPTTKEQRDILMKAIKDAGYEWDIKKKELKKKKL